MEEPEPLGRRVVVLVDFREPVGEGEVRVVDGVAEGDLHEVLLGEDLLHLPADVLVEAVVVVDVEEAAAGEIAAEAGRLGIGEDDVAVAVEVEVRVRVELVARELDDVLPRCDVQQRLLPHEPEQRRQRLLAAVPVAAPAVLHARNGKGVLAALRRDRRGAPHHEQDDETQGSDAAHEAVERGKGTASGRTRRPPLLVRIVFHGVDGGVDSGGRIGDRPAGRGTCHGGLKVNPLRPTEYPTCYAQAPAVGNRWMGDSPMMWTGVEMWIRERNRCGRRFCQLRAARRMWTAARITRGVMNAFPHGPLTPRLSTSPQALLLVLLIKISLK